MSQLPIDLVQPNDEHIISAVDHGNTGRRFYVRSLDITKGIFTFTHNRSEAMLFGSIDFAEPICDVLSRRYNAMWAVRYNND
jgi:hypothetical protein